MINLPNTINESLVRQERHLQRIKNEGGATDRIVEKISKKIKKDKSDMLINKVESYRAKKELHEMLENNDSQYNELNSWYFPF